MKSYEVVKALEIYSDLPRTQKDKEKMIREMDESEILKHEEASLYGFRSVQVPRSLLYRTQLRNVSPAARSVYIWIMTKQRILEIEASAGVENEETARLPIVTARNIEIAKYTGVHAGSVSRQIKELEAADLLRTKKIKDGGRTKGTLYKLPKWPVDNMGYFNLPIKTMLTPAWINLTHSARWLWLLLLSEHCAKRNITGDRFPVFEHAYNEIKKHGINSDETIRRAIMELEIMGFAYIKHGKWDKDNGQREMNTYQISADHLHLWENTVKEIKADLQARWKRIPAAA